MQDRTKNIIVTVGFIAILIGTFFLNILVKDAQISTSERRKLEQFPNISFKQILNGQFMDKLETYVSDQFVQRDFFRTIKSMWSINIFKQKDNNDLFIKDNAIYKIDYPLKEKNVEKSASKINQVYEKYLKNMNVYYAVIPDKNYYLENDEHLKIDYSKLLSIMKNKLKDIKYIDIWNDLKLEDYYKTDLHWKQENLDKVVNKLQKEMNMENISNISYSKKEIGNFYGTYYGQLGLNITPDKLYILSNDVIDNCYTYNYEKNKKGKIYEKTNSIDMYDIFVSGATPLISIENPNAKTDKELLLFRDSFGSSLAPLLVENYAKITLIDLRYISNTLLPNYINFDKQDVLFLYSSTVLNQNVLK